MENSKLKELMENSRKESSSVLMFLEECSIIPSKDSGEKKGLQELYSLYCAYCSETGNRFRVNKRTFAKSLRNQNFKDSRDKDGIVFYCREDPAVSRVL